MATHEIRNVTGAFKGTGYVSQTWGGDVILKVGGEKFNVATNVARVDAVDVQQKNKLSFGKTMLRSGLAAVATSNWGKNDVMAGLAGGLASSVDTYSGNTVVQIMFCLMDGRVFGGESSYETYKLLAGTSQQLDDDEIADIITKNKRQAAMLEEAELVIGEVKEELLKLENEKGERQKQINESKGFDERFKLKEELEGIKQEIEEKAQLHRKLERHIAKKRPFNLWFVFFSGVAGPLAIIWWFEGEGWTVLVGIWAAIGIVWFGLEVLFRVVKLAFRKAVRG